MVLTAPMKPTKLLSKSLTSVFKVFLKEIDDFNKNPFSLLVLISGNNEPVINSISNFNKRSEASSILYFDFSALY